MKRWLIWGPALLFICATCLIALTHMEPAATAQTPEAVSQILELDVNGLPLYIDLNADGVWYDLQQMTSEFSMPIVVKQLQGYQLYLNGEPAELGQTAMVRLDRLEKHSGVEIRLVRKGDGAERRYYIRGLHQAAKTVFIILRAAVFYSK